MKATIQNVADVVVAGSAMSLPLWRERLHEVAGTVGDFGVIFGALFLVMRMVHLIVHWNTPH